MIAERLIYGFDAEPLADTQSLRDKESLLSWVARNSIDYHLPNITTILRDVGQAYRNSFVDVMRGDIDVQALAMIIGAPVDQVNALRGQSAGNGKVRYLGAKIRNGDIHTRARRFAPAALAIGEVPYYRASWLIRTFPVCTETWQVLRTRCDCGAKQTWATINSAALCESCGTDLRDLSSEVVEPECQDGLRFLADILFGDDVSRQNALGRLPEDLCSIDPGEVYEVALLVARIIDPTMPNPRENLWRDDPLRLANALSKAADLLPHWPHAVWLALGDRAMVRNLQPRDAALITLRDVLRNQFSTGLPASVRNALEALYNGIDLDGEHPPEEVVDLDRAATILRMNKPDIRAARRIGHLESHFVIRRGEILSGYSRAELEAIAATKSWPAAATVTRQTCIPPYGLEQLCAMDELDWAKPPHRTLLEGLKIDPASIQRLWGDLTSSALPLNSLCEPVPLSTIMRGVGGREKPWGPVVRALRERKWPFAMIGGQASIRSVRVEKSHAREIRAMAFNPKEWIAFSFDDEIMQADACDILNVPLQERGALVKYRSHECGGSWIFDREKILSLSQSTITSAELGATFFLVPKTCVSIIRSIALEKRDYGYIRFNSHKRFAAAVARKK